jgi:sialate O-acetylesterase
MASPSPWGEGRDEGGRKSFFNIAEIGGDMVVASSPDISKPVAGRYSWADFPEVNLRNKVDLPASPFRTDSFPRVTAPK